MSKFLKCAVLLAAMLPATNLAAAQDKAPPPAAPQPEMNAAMKAEIERQFFVGMIALKDYCKVVDPATAVDIDQSWTKNTADVPAELQAMSTTPEFAAKVTARVKELAETSKTPAAAAEVKAACAKMIVTK
jgi:hypothetical protein